MKIEELQVMWEEDCKLNVEDITWEQTRTPLLHSKYFNLLNEARRQEIIFDKKINVYKRLRSDWLIGRMSEDDMKELGWEPNNHRILKSEVSSYLEADETYNKMIEKLENHRIKLKFLEGIVYKINGRSFDIKNLIEWEKFKNAVV